MDVPGRLGSHSPLWLIDYGPEQGTPVLTENSLINHMNILTKQALQIKTYGYVALMG